MPNTYLFLGRTLGLAAAAWALTSCGEDAQNDPLASAQLVQDVRLVEYFPKKAQWEIKVQSVDNVEETIRKEVSFNDGASKDRMKRIFEEGKFLLVINDQKAQIAIAPDGQMKYDQSATQEVDGCKFNARSGVQGKADHLRVNLTWTLDSQLEGAGCTDQLKAQFAGFIDSELNRLNLNSAKDLLAALEQVRTNSKGLNLVLRLEAAIRPPASK